jgi:hypothetical protein
MHHRKRKSRDNHPSLRDVTADTGNTTSSIVACWTVFTELLPGNALIKSVKIYIYIYYMKLCQFQLTLIYVNGVKL